MRRAFVVDLQLLERNSSNLVLLLICVLSRLFSTIYYFEDSASMAFVNAVSGVFNDSIGHQELIAHPLFIMVIKSFYLVFGSLSIPLSIIGGLSVYVIIFYILRILSLPLFSLEGMLTAILVFFNPLIWIVSNKFQPDIAGLALLMAALYYLLKSEDAKIGWMLAGLLAGVKISYLPFLVLPCIYSIFENKKYLHAILYFVSGIAIFIIPVCLFEGFAKTYQLYCQSLIDCSIHVFNSISGNNYGLRMVYLIQAIWADGLGGYWSDRNPALLLNSAGIIGCSVFGFLILLNFGFDKLKMKVIAGSVFIYFICTYLFGNIHSQSQEVLPLIIFNIVLISYGIIYFLVNFNFGYVKVLALVYIMGGIFLTVILAVQHTYPSAIAQVREYIVNQKYSEKEFAIYSEPGIGNFLENQHLSIDLYKINSEFVTEDLLKMNSSKKKIIFISATPFNLPSKPSNSLHFSHNPYVNKEWSDIYIYEF